MSINTQELYDLKRVKYSASEESERFARAFFYGLLMTLNDLNSDKVGLSLDIPDDLETDIEADDQYFNVISIGLDYYIQETGEWGSDDSSELFQKYQLALGRAHTLLFMDSSVVARLGDQS